VTHATKPIHSNPIFDIKENLNPQTPSQGDNNDKKRGLGEQERSTKRQRVLPGPRKLSSTDEEHLRIKEENVLLERQLAEKSERITKLERELRSAAVTFYRIEDIITENERLTEENKLLNNEIETLSALYTEARAEVDEWAQRLNQE